MLVLRGSPEGVAPTGTVLRGISPGDRFGAALTLSARVEQGSLDDLWIGAPGTDVSGRSDAGAVHHVVFSPGGTATPASVLTQGSAGVPDAAEPGDRFGEVLAPYADGVLVGVPHEDVGSRRDAGVVIAASSSTSRRFTFPHARAGDRFGAAVDTGIAGAPGRDLPGARDAGVAQLLGEPDRDRLAQGVRGLPGRFERGDHFGAAVTRRLLVPLPRGVVLRDRRAGRGPRPRARRRLGHDRRAARSSAAPRAG